MWRQLRSNSRTPWRTPLDFLSRNSTVNKRQQIKWAILPMRLGFFQHGINWSPTPLSFCEEAFINPVLKSCQVYKKEKLGIRNRNFSSFCTAYHTKALGLMYRTFVKLLQKHNHTLGSSSYNILFLPKVVCEFYLNQKVYWPSFFS